MKSANWISAIGIRPLSAAPIATPTIADSASGVSSTRASPKRACRPSVAPKTPPLRPTSSPMTSTRSSRSISSAMAARTASIIRISGIGSLFLQDIVQRAGRFWQWGLGRLLQGGLDHLDAVALDEVVRVAAQEPGLDHPAPHHVDRVVARGRLEPLFGQERLATRPRREGRHPGVDQ